MQVLVFDVLASELEHEVVHGWRLVGQVEGHLRDPRVQCVLGHHRQRPRQCVVVGAAGPCEFIDEGGLR